MDIKLKLEQKGKTRSFLFSGNEVQRGSFNVTDVRHARIHNTNNCTHLLIATNDVAHMRVMSGGNQLSGNSEILYTADGLDVSSAAEFAIWLGATVQTGNTEEILDNAEYLIRLMADGKFNSWGDDYDPNGDYVWNFRQNLGRFMLCYIPGGVEEINFTVEKYKEDVFVQYFAINVEE